LPAFILAPEPQLAGARAPGQNVRIALIEDRKSISGLPAQDILFRGTVRFDRAVSIEVIRREVGDDGDVRIGFELGQVVKLKAAELEDNPVGWPNLVGDGQQALADVATQPGFVCPGTQQGMNHRGGRRFTVAARHANRPSAVALPEQIHLAGHAHARIARQLQVFVLFRDGGAGDHEIGIAEIGLAMFPEVLLDMGTICDLRQGGRQFACRFEIGHRYQGALIGQKADSADPASKGAQPHHGHALAAKIGWHYRVPRDVILDSADFDAASFATPGVDQ